MTHEPIRVIHFSPHITWQGTQSELEAMLAEGCPVGSASEIIAACWRDTAEAKAYAAELEAKLAKAVKLALEECPFRWGKLNYDEWWHHRRATLAALKGESK
jgi:hypothetical protein